MGLRMVDERFYDSQDPHTCLARGSSGGTEPRRDVRGLPLTIQHIQESLCRAHIQALAGMAGVIYEATNSFDYGVDGRFQPVVMRGSRHVTSGHSLDFQAKATTNWELKNNHIIYDLEAKTYNDMVSRSPSETTLILVLLCLPREQVGWHASTATETTLRHCCYWHILSDQPTENATTKRIQIPCENLLTPETLNGLLIAERTRRERQTA
jgi:uncharacterized protein DUF4365